MPYKDMDKGYWVGETRITTWDGRVKKRKKRGFKTKSEAVEWEVMTKRLSTPSMELTLEQFIEVYFNDKSIELKERTIQNKRYMMERHIVPYLGSRKMKDIAVTDVIEWQKEILMHGYSETYQRMLQNQLTALFTHASKLYDLKNNPCKKVKKIGKSDIRRLEFWTREQYEQFISTFDKGSKYYVLFEILFWSGCRIGEALALTFSDIEQDTGIMHITKTYYRKGGKDMITAPKTKESVRDVVLPKFLLDEISEYSNRFYDCPGSMRMFDNGHAAVRRVMNRHTEKAGLPHIPIHGFRHSAAAFLISQGVIPMVIKERLGHKDIRITLNTYGHLYPNQQQELARMLDQVKGIST